MCGIVGILGRAPVAEQLVDSLKRLEYRGYDSAGVATLEGDHLARRRAEGKLKNLEKRLQAEPLQGHIGIGHTRWATHGKPTENNAHPHATDRVAVVHNGIIENFRELRERLEKKGTVFKTETDTEIVLHLVDQPAQAGHQAGRGGEGGVVGAARRVRARIHLRRRRRSDDRRPQRSAAGDRSRRRRNVSGVGCDRARAVYRYDQLSRRRRLGGADAQGRDHLRQEQRDRSSRRDQAHGLDLAGRQGELSPLHGQGNPRAAGSGRPYPCPLCRHGERAGEAAGDAAVRLQGYPADLDHGLRHRELCGLCRQILVRAAGARAGRSRCRLGIPLPRGAAAQGRSRDLHFAVRRDRRYAGRAALRQGGGRAHAIGGQRADVDDRARKRDRAADAGRSRNRRRLDQGLHLPADGAGRAGGRRRQGEGRIVG